MLDECYKRKFEKLVIICDVKGESGENIVAGYVSSIEKGLGQKVDVHLVALLMYGTRGIEV